ncbi:MAG: 30S ribosomal protein S4 [Candidatus Aenigmatarchaeota archaeon]
MGHPKKHRSKIEMPKRPYDKMGLKREKKLMQDFGLRRKKEIRSAEALLRNFRRRARELLAKRNEEKEKTLFLAMKKLGIVPDDAKLEDVLDTKLEHIMSRRLQTVVYKKGLANSIKHARQLIVHGHVRMAKKRIVFPAYIVEKEEESGIELVKQV